MITYLYTVTIIFLTIHFLKRWTSTICSLFCQSHHCSCIPFLHHSLHLIIPDQYIISVYQASIHIYTFEDSCDLPEGRCVILTALSVVLTCWPPAPLARFVSIFRSLSNIWISICKVCAHNTVIPQLPGCTTG